MSYREEERMPSPAPALAAELERKIAALTAPMIAEYERLHAMHKSLVEHELRAGSKSPDLLGCRYVQLLVATLRAPPSRRHARRGRCRGGAWRC